MVWFHVKDLSLIFKAQGTCPRVFVGSPAWLLKCPTVSQDVPAKLFVPAVCNLLVGAMKAMVTMHVWTYLVVSRAHVRPI